MQKRPTLIENLMVQIVFSNFCIKVATKASNNYFSWEEGGGNIDGNGGVIGKASDGNNDLDIENGD